MTSRALILAIILIIASGVMARVIHKVRHVVFTQSDVYEALERKRLNAHIIEMEMELGIIPKTDHFFNDGTPVPPPPVPEPQWIQGARGWVHVPQFGQIDTPMPRSRGTVSGGPR